MISVRQVDSSTGILLFLFQAFLIDHGITAIPLRKIFRLMEPFGKSESAIRMGLSRGVKSGLLVNRKCKGTVYYGLSSKTIWSSQEWRTTFTEFAAAIPRQTETWNQTWTLVVTPDTSKLEPELTGTHFGQLNRSIWVSPFSLARADQEKLETHNHGVAIFQAQHIAGLTAKEIANRVWKTKKLAQHYSRYCSELTTAFTRLQEEADVGPKGLLFLHKYGMKLFELLQRDPQLPLDLLPENWCGLKAFQEFRRLRAEIHPLSKQWVLSILDDGKDD